MVVNDGRSTLLEHSLLNRLQSLPRRARQALLNIHRNPVFRIVVLACLIGFMNPGVAQAYVGPGAGIAFASSLFAVFLAVISAIVMLITWPVRLLYRRFFAKRPPGKPRFKRVVILGLDGMDHKVTSEMLDAGQLPNLARLREQGGFSSLGSTLPPISPVAWSSFQTGVNPGKHNIFDFVIPDEYTYQPKLSSVEIHPPRRNIRVWKWSLPIGRPEIRQLRKSKPFWGVMSDYGIFNCIIRVPITFPPEKLRGVQLSAMCVPDLRGTQGESTTYTTRSIDHEQSFGGLIVPVTQRGPKLSLELTGPRAVGQEHDGPLTISFQVTVLNADRCRLRICGQVIELHRGEYSDWVAITFGGGFSAKAHGVCKFLLLSAEPEFELYVSPINLDPERPMMPIGYPAVYPIYLAKLLGSYATLGLAEDTSSLSDQILDDAQFHQQCRDTDREREAMFFDALENVPSGLCVCVFDGSDRMQHMFWRYHDPDHPARPKSASSSSQNAIHELYQRMDQLVGRTMEKCEGTDTLLMVLSDHGFNSFRYGIDLNRWLELKGYLKVDDARRDEKYLAGVDWSQTRAFAIGLTGIFLNLEDRFSQGIVKESTAEQLRTEIASQLAELVDPQTSQKPIKHVYQAAKAYRGPYKNRAPDLIVGYERGYRVSWEAANGQTTRELVHANTRAWSGDHCVDPSVVPGVLFCNHKVDSKFPRLVDIGPTVLNLFGIPVPTYMDGEALVFANGSPATSPPSTN